ncbi:MAG: hypothetical protein KDE46_27785 [Caldilineaceae bacterium]|nr:hypothetical protein [Caldilineaceae bacterium]
MLMSLCINAIWVLGLSGFGAALSFAHWQKLVEHRSWRVVLDGPAMQRIVALSLLLISLGQLLAASILDVHVAWLRVSAWALFVLIFTGKLVLTSQVAAEQ